MFSSSWASLITQIDCMNVQLQNHSGTAVLTWNNWAVLSVCLWFRFSNGRFFTSLIQSANQSCDDQLSNKVLKHIFLNHWKSLGCVVPKSNSVRFTKNELPGDFRVLLHIAPLGSEKKRTFLETFEYCCILHHWDRQFQTSTKIATSMKIEITRDVELIA